MAAHGRVVVVSSPGAGSSLHWSHAVASSHREQHLTAGLADAAWDHPERVVDRFTRRQSHDMIQHAETVGRAELDGHLTHWRIGHPAVGGLPQTTLGQARRPLRP